MFHGLKEKVMVFISIYLDKTEGNVEITELPQTKAVMLSSYTISKLDLDLSKFMSTVAD
jgi:hypothetical protein